MYERRFQCRSKRGTHMDRMKWCFVHILFCVFTDACVVSVFRSGKHYCLSDVDVLIEVDSKTAKKRVPHHATLITLLLSSLYYILLIMIIIHCIS